MSPSSLFVALSLSTRAAAAGSADDPCAETPRDGFCTVCDNTLTADAIAVDASPNGGISVVAWDRPDIHVRAVIEADGPTAAAAQRTVEAVKVHAQSGRIWAEGPSSGRWSVRYVIEAPAQTALDLETVNGGLSVEGIRAEIALETVNGGIHLADVGGSVHGTTVNGPVAVELGGSGWGGPFDADVPALALTTTNGPVSLAVPRGYSAVLDLSTTLGPVALGLPVVPGRPSVIGSGGALIRMATQRGPIAVHER